MNQERRDLHPLFIEAPVKNREFLTYAEGCRESGLGKRRLDGERLMAFELSDPAEQGGFGACREYNRLAETAAESYPPSPVTPFQAKTPASQS
jgi:hypothetical protein